MTAAPNAGPINNEIEQALLGALLLQDGARVAEIGGLRPEHFGVPVHGRIYQAILDTVRAGKPANPLTLGPVFEQDTTLAQFGGGQRYLTELVIPAAVALKNTPAYAAEIFDLWRRRQFIDACLDAMDRAGTVSPSDTLEDIIAGVEQSLRGVTQPRAAKATLEPTPFVLRDPREIEPRAWLYGDHLIRRYVSATVAIPGLGKSALELIEALAMVTGRPLLGVEPIEGPLRVWYYSEDPVEEIERRIAAACLHYHISADDIGGRLFIDSARAQGIVIAKKTPSGIIVIEPVVEALKAAIARRGIDVFTVDPFISCHEVPENDNGAMDFVVKKWAAIADSCNCAVELVHHVRKGSSGNGSGEYQIEDARGGGSIIAAVRSARVCNVMSKQEAEKAKIDPGQRRRYFRVDNGKANLMPPPEKGGWRKLLSRSLGNERGLRPADKVQVVTIWEWPEQAAGDRAEVSVHDLIELQQRVAAGTYRADPRADNWVGKIIAEVLGFDLLQSAARKEIHRLLQSWIESGALREVKRTDEKRRKRQFIEVGTLAQA
jgi:hypothetical protein